MNNNKSKKGFKMTNLKATREEHQKRFDTYAKVKENWANNFMKIEKIDEEIEKLQSKIARYEEEKSQITKQGQQFCKDNFRKYYPDTWGKVKETDTQQEKQNKRDYWTA